MAARQIIQALAAVSATMAIIFPTPAAEASTLSVNCNAGDDLQAKINAATSGDTILVKGSCVGNFVIIDKSLTLKGNLTATLDGNVPPMAVASTRTTAHSR